MSCEVTLQFHPPFPFSLFRPLKNLTSPGGEPVLLELLHLEGGGPVVHRQDPDEVRYSQHANKPQNKASCTTGTNGRVII